VNPALEYAENTLGVHKVYEDALALEGELDSLMGRFDIAVDARKELDEQIEDREMELLIAERGKAPDIPQAAMDRRIKEVKHKDSVLRELRANRRQKAAEASGLELDIDLTKVRLKVRAARMEELAGYFNYLAAVKNATPPPVLYAEAGTPATKATGGEAKKQGDTE